MTTDRVPRVTVGLPVYNGERFLRQAIDAFSIRVDVDSPRAAGDGVAIRVQFRNPIAQEIRSEHVVRTNPPEILTG